MGRGSVVEEGPVLLAAKLPLPMRMGGNGRSRFTLACGGEAKRGHSRRLQPTPIQLYFTPWAWLPEVRTGDVPSQAARCRGCCPAEWGGRGRVAANSVGAHQEPKKPKSPQGGEGGLTGWCPGPGSACRGWLHFGETCSCMITGHVPTDTRLMSVAF